jgi:putative FmdB family regulatory protein
MTYEYLCTACGNVWEAEQSISAAPLKVCPRCHAETAKRQVSGGAGFILKGGGWYADLYGSAPKKSDAGSSDSSSSGDAKSSSGDAKKTTETKKSDSTSSDSGSSSKETSKGSGGGTDTGSKGSSGSKGGADSSAA